MEDTKNSIINAPADLAAVVDAEWHLEDAHMALQHVETKVKAKENALGINDRIELCKLMQSIFITTQMNALALKIRLWEHLCAHKYELDLVERSFRCQKNGVLLCGVS